jgi:hypothetical protein
MQTKSRFFDFDFDHLKESNWGLIALAVIVDAALLTVAMLVILPFFKNAFPIERFTNGLVGPTLIFSLARFIFVVLGVAMLVGKLRPRDLGLQWEKLSQGAVVVFGLWILMQVIGALLHLIATGKVGLSPIWTPEKIPFIAGGLIAQFLGNAFAEEVIFRGFLLTQVALLLKGKITKHGKLLTASIFLSQFIFALTHIPQRIATGYPLPSMLINLVLLWVIGSLFAVLYLRTDNIFVVIGIHALANMPVTVLALPSRAVGELLIYLLALALVFAWGPLMRWIKPEEDSGQSPRFEP